ncbi:single-stranded-DNA-specific exonuclease RecJ [archaeon]|nr:single-stranded-DNA-specific exonuclease RecJ [archaeon]
MSDGKVIYKIKKLTKKQVKDSSILTESGVHPVMSDLYTLRGIENFNDINLLQRLEPFENMKGIKEAAKILAQAILKKEAICIVADYDVDGATACTVAVRGLKMFGANVSYVVPDRFIHGYGLTPSVVDEAIKKKNPDLIVTVDNGISSFDGVIHAKKHGVKVLVTDHHLPSIVNGVITLPEDCVIVNPNQPNCNFKSKSLCGCGVMFYVLAALRQHMIDLDIYTVKTVPNVFSLLDLVAIGTIADVVKLDLNNRIIVKLGLDFIRKKQTKVGVLAIIDVAKTKYEKLSTIDIGFKLGPRINAAGRLEDMTIGINCLLTDNPETAKNLAIRLNEINQKRRVLESEMKEEALDLQTLKDTQYAKVAFSENFHEGVIGIVASRIKEQFYRPTIVFSPSHDADLIKGSGRSIPEINLRDALDYVYKKRPDIIVKFGGHAMAAGLTIKREFLSDFIELFDMAVKYFSEDKELLNMKEIDFDLPGKFINLETAEHIQDGIWGQGFPQPLFIGEFNIIEQRILKNAHLKLLLEKDGVMFEGIWFFTNTELEVETAKIVYTIGINDFLNNKKVQIIIEGIY